MKLLSYDFWVFRILLFSLVFLPGIAYSQQIEGIDSIPEIGYFPPSEADEQLFQEYVEDYSGLKNPFDAKVRDLKLVKANGNALGYCARINAKNGYGNYGNWNYISILTVSGNIDANIASAKTPTAALAYCRSISSGSTYTERRTKLDQCAEREGFQLGAVWTLCGQNGTFLGADKYNRLPDF